MIRFLVLALGLSIIYIHLPVSVNVYAESDRNYEALFARSSYDYNLNDLYFSDISKPAIDENNRKIAEALRIQEEQRIAEEQALEAQRVAQIRKAQQAKKAVTVNFNKPAPQPKNEIEAMIIHWTAVFGGDATYHINIARCESGLNANSSGGGGLYLGIYQQHVKYWPARATKFGFAGASPFDANANIAVSIKMMRTQGYYHWPSCSKKALYM